MAMKWQQAMTGSIHTILVVLGVLYLAAQCEIPPHTTQYPVEIVSQRGVSHPFALFS